MSTKGRVSKLARLHSEPSRADGEQGQKLEKGSAKISGADAAKEAAAHQCICQSARVSIVFTPVCLHWMLGEVFTEFCGVPSLMYLDVPCLRQALFGGNPTDVRQIPTQGCEDSLNLNEFEVSGDFVEIGSAQLASLNTTLTCCSLAAERLSSMMLLNGQSWNVTDAVWGSLPWCNKCWASMSLHEFSVLFRVGKGWKELLKISWADPAHAAQHSILQWTRRTSEHSSFSSMCASSDQQLYHHDGLIQSGNPASATNHTRDIANQRHDATTNLGDYLNLDIPKTSRTPVALGPHGCIIRFYRWVLTSILACTDVRKINVGLHDLSFLMICCSSSSWQLYKVSVKCLFETDSRFPAILVDFAFDLGSGSS